MYASRLLVILWLTKKAYSGRERACAGKDVKGKDCHVMEKLKFVDLWRELRRQDTSVGNTSHYDNLWPKSKPILLESSAFAQNSSAPKMGEHGTSTHDVRPNEIFTVCVIGEWIGQPAFTKLTDKLGALIAKKGFNLVTAGKGIEDPVGNLAAVRAAFYKTKNKQGNSIWVGDQDDENKGKIPNVNEVDTDFSAYSKGDKYKAKKRAIDLADAIVVLPGGEDVPELMKYVWRKGKPVISLITEEDEMVNVGKKHQVTASAYTQHAFYKYVNHEDFRDVQAFLDLKPDRLVGVRKTVAVIGNTRKEHKGMDEAIGKEIAGKGCSLITGGPASSPGLLAVRKTFGSVKDRKGKSIWTPTTNELEEFKKEGGNLEQYFIDDQDPNGKDEKKQLLQADLIVALPGGPGVLKEIRLAQAKGKPIMGFISDDEVKDEHGVVNKIVKNAFSVKLSTDPKLKSINQFFNDITGQSGAGLEGGDTREKAAKGANDKAAKSRSPSILQGMTGIMTIALLCLEI
eukprot:gnl/MRDRNA2_/MRDRNA2_166541_c0_seq1.p1 gnl/MRDRNA2_/MRDRNA2_166541_c0~~gnl/MRDRNA2_/MRDRNA2_166541_c0_seq1.p1  ORF type:complete len:513 (+),score=100.90 gnl/MRDRNA2_/MRDRNA2_166541_c0_seq1:2-1540(+)